MSAERFQIGANFPWSEIAHGAVLWSRGQMAESHLEFTKPAHVVGRYALIIAAPLLGIRMVR